MYFLFGKKIGVPPLNAAYGNFLLHQSIYQARYGEQGRLNFQNESINFNAFEKFSLFYALLGIYRSIENDLLKKKDSN